jgi:peptide/nickel transport system ATP-binding protein
MSMSETVITSPLIELRGLKKDFPLPQSPLAHVVTCQPKSVVHAVNGVDLAIWRGETVGLVGESGSGKTTHGRVMARLYETTAGEVYFQGKVLKNGNVIVSADREGRPQPPVQTPY